MDDINYIVMEAKKDERKLEELLISQKWFVIRCCSDFSKRYITDSDDEYSIGLSAYAQAVSSFDDTKGNFVYYARLVINRRLTDMMRAKTRIKEISISPDVFEDRGADEITNFEGAVYSAVTVASIIATPNRNIAEEIEAVNAIFCEYGFSFFDLATCSPKALKTKEACAKVVNNILKERELFKTLLEAKQLPLKKIEISSGVPRKILERHRKYIIAAVIILSGGYPNLSEYLHFIKKGEH